MPARSGRARCGGRKPSAAAGSVPSLGNPVAAADDRLDQRRLPEFPPQAQDSDRDGVGERVGVLVPDLLEELLGRHYRAVGRDEHLEHTELLAGQGDGPAGPGDRPAGPVDDQVTPGVHRRRGGAAAAQGTDPGGQLGEVEGLDQIVVGPQVQPFHPVLDQSGGGEPLPPASPSPCSAPPQPGCWASTGSGPACGSGSAPAAPPASGSTSPAFSTPTPTRPRSTPPSWSASPPPRSTWAWTGTPRRSTSAPPTPRPPSPASTTCSAPRQTRKTPARSTSPAPRTPSPPAPRPRARSTPCSSASAPSPSSSARSASPTS